MRTIGKAAGGIRLTLLLGLLAAVPPLSIDISIPAVIAIERDLGASAQLVGLTITIFMAGFAIGQCVSGPLSDRVGRRPVLLGGLTAFALAGVGCALAGSGGQLVFWRLIQGAAAGACAVLAFAVIRDLFEGDAARSQRSYVTVVFGLAPMLAPALGAVILAAAGWRAIFAVLMLSGLALLAATTILLPESLPKSLPKSLPSHAGRRHRPLGAGYAAVLSNGRFVVLAAVNALSYGGMFAYIAGSSQVFMGSLGLPAAAYAAVFACTAAALTAGAWTSGRCARAGVGADLLVWAGLAVAAGVATVLSLAVSNGITGLPVLAPLLMLCLFCRGLVSPTVQHLALDPLRHDAGTAAAAVGVAQILSGAAASAVVALLLPQCGPAGMVAVMAVLGTTALALWAWLASRPAPALP